MGLGGSNEDSKNVNDIQTGSIHRSKRTDQDLKNSFNIKQHNVPTIFF